jgi:1-acyl-sn-glycerol-3-phosphate acyltransferase
VILAANHRSFMDSVFLALASPRPIAFMAKAEYFDRRSTAWIFRHTGQIPLRRDSVAGARVAMRSAGEVLRGGGVLGIYPEGTRSLDGRLHRGRPGPARLALTWNAPIVPIGLIGTDAVQAPGESAPHLFRPVSVRVGAPCAPPASAGDRKESSRILTDAVMREIASLCGQEYVDDYTAIPG